MKDRQQLLLRIGAEIRRKREKKKLTLVDLEAMVDISKKQLIKIEHGKANFTVYSLFKLTQVLEIDINKLLKQDN